MLIVICSGMCPKVCLLFYQQEEKGTSGNLLHSHGFFLQILRIFPMQDRLVLHIVVMLKRMKTVFSAAWGYHQQGYCQAGFSAVASEVSKMSFFLHILLCLLVEKKRSKSHIIYTQAFSKLRMQTIYMPFKCPAELTKISTFFFCRIVSTLEQWAAGIGKVIMTSVFRQSLLSFQCRTCICLLYACHVLARHVLPHLCIPIVNNRAHWREKAFCIHSQTFHD